MPPFNEQLTIPFGCEVVATLSLEIRVSIKSACAKDFTRALPICFMLDEIGACLRNKYNALRHLGSATTAEATHAIQNTNSKPFNLALPDDLLEYGGYYSWRVDARDVNEDVRLGDFNMGSLSAWQEFTIVD